MFPTHVGMNRVIRLIARFHSYVPHTRGDEPHDILVKAHLF